jgi:hypothetical protein
MATWFAIYPRDEHERTMTARWTANNTTTEVTATFGPLGGLSSPADGQGLEYKISNHDSLVEQTAVIRVDGVKHTTTMPGGALHHEKILPGEMIAS